MIFNSSAILYGIYKYNKKTEKIMKKENFYIYIFITIVFFLPISDDGEYN